MLSQMSRILMSSLLVCFLVLVGFQGNLRAESSKLPPGCIAKDGSVVTSQERQAIATIVSFMEACNEKDADKVRKINLSLEGIPDEEVANTLFAASNYTLHSVEVIASTADKISVNMLYSCEIKIPNTIGRNINHSRTFVELGYFDQDGWRITKARTNPGMTMKEQLQAEEKAAGRYGVRDLSKWRDLPGLKSDLWKWYEKTRLIERQIYSSGINPKELAASIAKQKNSLQEIRNSNPVGEGIQFAEDALFALDAFNNTFKLIVTSAILIDTMSNTKDKTFNALLSDGLAGKSLQDKIKKTAPQYYDYLDERIRLADPSRAQTPEGSWKASVAIGVLRRYMSESLDKLVASLR